MMYQVYKDGKPFGSLSSSKLFLEEGAKRLRNAYPEASFEVREIKHNAIRASDLVIGNTYRWSAANNRPCKLLGIRKQEEDGTAIVEMLDGGTVYIGASTQLSDAEE